MPFRIRFALSDASSSQFTYVDPQPEPTPSAVGFGDGNTWNINLGPPLLQLTHQNLNDDTFRDFAVQVFRTWIRVDRETIARFHQGVSAIEAVQAWATNQFPGAVRLALAWNPTPGANIPVLGNHLSAGLLSLGVHLQHQDDRDAYRLIDVLDWISVCEFGSGTARAMINGLREGLRTRRDQGLSPRPN
jgi:hypothetical protein